jgi:hypothetical protein
LRQPYLIAERQLFVNSIILMLHAIQKRKNGKIVYERNDFSDVLNDELASAETEMIKEVPKSIKLVIIE